MLPLFLSIKRILKASKMIFYILLLTVIHVQMACKYVYGQTIILVTFNYFLCFVINLVYVNAVYLNQKSKPGKEIYDDYELTNFFECFCKCKNSAVRFLPAECKSYMVSLLMVFRLRPYGLDSRVLVFFRLNLLSFYNFLKNCKNLKK